MKATFSVGSVVSAYASASSTASLFALFLLTVIVFGSVIITLVRWVDRIARLGRMGSTIEKVANATAKVLRRRHDAPTLHGSPISSTRDYVKRCMPIPLAMCRRSIWRLCRNGLMKTKRR